MSSKDTIVVSGLLDEDLENVYKLANRSSLAYWTKADYYEELNRSDSIFLRLSIDNVFAGFLVGRVVAGIEDDTLDAELYNIAVSSSHRRLGGARHLMEVFISECRSNKVRNIWLDVRSNNMAAIDLYKDFGFENVSIRKRYYKNPADDALVMQKVL